jgi:uncharacterized protein
MLRQLVLAAILSGVFNAATAQEQSSGAKPPSTKHFLIILKPARPGFVETPTSAEQKTVGQHFAYLKKLAADGKVLLAGPSINGANTFGIVVVEAASEADARSVMEGDPSVKAGVMKGELLPFTLSLMRGR